MEVVEIIGNKGSGKSVMMNAFSEKLEMEGRFTYWICNKIKEEHLKDIEKHSNITIFMDTNSKETFDYNLEILKTRLDKKLCFVYGTYYKE